MSSRPSVRTLSVLLVGALVVAAVLLAEGLRSRGRPTPAVRGARSTEVEPTPGVETGDEISASAEWFYEQRAYPAAHTPRGALARAQRQAKALRTAPGPRAPTVAVNWAELGPKPIATIGPAVFGMYVGSPPFSGRVSAIATDPSNAGVVYIGGAVGGVWKSTDGGASWAPKFPTNQGSFAIGALAVDPSNPQNVWVGTGEPDNVMGPQGDTYFGMGIYRSTNGGSSWTKVGGTTFDGCFVADLAIVDSNTVVAAVLEFPGVQNPACPTARRGVWRTTDGGSTWTKITLPNSSHQAPSDFSQPPGSPSTIYLATYFDGVYRSTDGGAGWTNIGVENLYRGVASAYDANTVYVAYADPVTKNLAGVFKTLDGGTHWSGVVGPGGPNSPCDYNPPGPRPICDNALTLAVDPTDSTTFFLGGVRLFKYTSSGATATLIGWGGCSGCIHVDQHASVFDASHRLWIGNDGGVYRTDDGGASFVNRNGSGAGALAITEFEPWTSGSIAGGTFIGGTQDNGTVKYTSATGLDWRMDHGGDGGATAFVSPSTYYASYFGPNLYKTVDGGTSYTDVSGAWAGDSSQMYPPLEMSPSSSSTLYRGTNRIWRTTDGAGSWSPISPIYGAYQAWVSAIGLAASNANVLYAGWTQPADANGNGTGPTQLRYTTNGGATWTDVPYGQLPNRYITDIEVNPANADDVTATFSGFGTGHVYRTTNGGTVWTNISGNLPDTPVNAVAVDYTTSPATIILGTDVGVLWSADGGTTWGDTSEGLPQTVVMDLRIDGSGLIAATHGRSAWTVSLPLPPPPPIAKAAQTISFGALAGRTFGDADFAVSATASSGLPVSFAAGGSCTVSGATVHLTGAGSCTVTASQAGNANYNAATDVVQSFTITKPVTPARCTVPKVVGKKLAAAKSALKQRHCGVGKVSYAYSAKVKKGLVSSQSRRLGQVLPNGTKVNLVVSRGRKR
jgi:photosystem II stability/assembly factor-like uncharacterized protein